LNKLVLRPFGIVHVLLLLLALPCIYCLFTWGRDVVMAFNLMTLLLCLGTCGLLFLIFRWVFGNSLTLHDDHIESISLDTTRTIPRANRVRIYYYDIEAYGVISGPHLRDFLRFRLIDGAIVSFDVEVYGDAQMARLLHELHQRTHIVPAGEVAPEKASGQARHPVLAGIGAFLGFFLIFLVLPVGSIWVEGFINPNHPPSYQSGWRIAYMLAAMFAAFGVTGVVLARKAAVSRPGTPRFVVGGSNADRFEQISMTATRCLYGLFVILFLVSVAT